MRKTERNDEKERECASAGFENHYTAFIRYLTDIIGDHFD